MTTLPFYGFLIECCEICTIKNNINTMETTITQEILAGVGKKLRNGYRVGTIPACRIIQNYKENLKESEQFSFFGLSIFDLMHIEQKTHNPILKARLAEQIEVCKQKSRTSNSQNKVSLEKLEYFRERALGIGLRKVLVAMKNLVKKSDSLEAQIVLTLLETEFANLSAKKRHSEKSVIYERKCILLENLSYMLAETDWRYGISYNTGKNASYIIYVYLPDGTQLSWHCNEYHLMYSYPAIDCEWDGMVCMTMEKILVYINKKYGIGRLTEPMEMNNSVEC